MRIAKWGIVAVLGAIAGVSVAHQANAGSKLESAMSVSVDGRYFSGGFGAVRNTTNTTEYMYCYSIGQRSTTASGQCYAKNAAGVSVSCSVNHAELIAEIRSMTEDSHILVSWDADGECKLIRTWKSSQYASKAL